MKIFPTNEEKVTEAYTTYKKNGDISDFLKEGGIWIKTYCLNKRIVDEDGASDLFLKFLDEAKNCLEIFEKRGYDNLHAFLCVYGRHLSMNMKRLRKKKEGDYDYLSLWDIERSMQKDPSSIYSQSAVRFIRSHLIHLKPENRVIFCLRYNLGLTKKDQKVLHRLLEKAKKQPVLFEEDRENRMKRLREREERIMERINFYNRKIYRKETTAKRSSFENKKRLEKELTGLQNAFTIKELSDYLNISSSKVFRVCQNSINYLKKQFDKLDAA